MSNEVCFLVVIFSSRYNTLNKFAIKTTTDIISQEMLEYPMEFTEQFGSLLPNDDRCFGPIVEIIEITDVIIETGA